MLYQTSPLDFSPEFDSAGIFIEHAGEILLLHRNPNDDFCGNKYGHLVGHSDAGENHLDTIIRETREEIGLGLGPYLNELKYFGKLLVRYPQFDFNHYLYQLTFDRRPQIDLDLNEHDSFVWVPPEKALFMPLVPDLDSVINLVYRL